MNTSMGGITMIPHDMFLKMGLLGQLLAELSVTSPLYL